MRIFTTLIIIFFTSFANAEETLSDKLSGYVYNLIPGEGTTEVSIDIRENYKPIIVFYSLENLLEMKIVISFHKCHCLIQKNLTMKEL